MYLLSGVSHIVFSVVSERDNRRFLKQLGFKLRSIRLERGWTLEQTEEHGWVSWRHLQQIETGRKNITVASLHQLSRVYKMPMSKILEDL